jgi:ribosomal protein S18 acetylase RimI-like enzyme
VGRHRNRCPETSRPWLCAGSRGAARQPRLSTWSKCLLAQARHASISGMPPDPQFRPLSRDEWPLLRHVRLRALHDFPQSFLVEHDEAVTYDRARWQTEFDRGDWIAGHINGKFVCCTGATWQPANRPDERYLEYVWVAPGYQRRSVAYKMLTDIIGKLTESGVRTIFLWTLVDGYSASVLYKKLHFNTTNERQELGGRLWERMRRDLL